MKKALYIILLISLFSSLFGETIRCNLNLKAACTDFTIKACKCILKNLPGNFALETFCNAPKRAICTGEDRILNCFCA